MRIVAVAISSLLAGSLGWGSAEARVAIDVDLSSQTMHVSSASGDYDWPISSARSGFQTPRGTYRVQRMEAMHRSHKYNNAPMPHSLFFSGGYVIHGSYEIAALGQPASHGCIRIAPGNAAALYDMVRAEGATINIMGRVPASPYRVARTSERIYAKARRRYDPYASPFYQPGEDVAGGGYYGYGDATQPLGSAPMEPGLYGWLSDRSDY